MKRTEGDEDDHPNADVDLATTVPVLEDSTSGVNVVWGDNQIFHEVVVPEGKPDGRVDETGRITGEATLVWNVGRHFAERNHDKVTNETDEAVPKKKTEGAASAGVGLEQARGRLADWRDLPDKRSSGSDDETGSDSTSEGNHGNLGRR